MNNEAVFLSLGSNVGDSVKNLRQAVVLLREKGFRLEAVSGIYQTAPIGNVAQKDFLNMVVMGKTEHSPIEMLAICLLIEKELGRVRGEHWGPRIIDLDLLFYGRRQIMTPKLQLPHPRLWERAFVLVPLREIAPQFFGELRVEIPPQKVELLISATSVKMMLSLNKWSQ